MTASPIGVVVLAGGEAVRIADSESEPVGSLDRDDVLRTAFEQRPEVAGEIEIAERVLLAPALLPDEEDRGAGPVLPTEHGVAQERAEVEVRVADGEPGRRPRAVRVDLVYSRGVALDGSGVPAVHAEVVFPGRRELFQ